jgi:hypothetical protein
MLFTISFLASLAAVGDLLARTVKYRLQEAVTLDADL